jgi:hypothetical protein
VDFIPSGGFHKICSKTSFAVLPCTCVTRPLSTLHLDCSSSLGLVHWSSLGSYRLIQVHLGPRLVHAGGLHALPETLHIHKVCRFTVLDQSLCWRLCKRPCVHKVCTAADIYQRSVGSICPAFSSLHFIVWNVCPGFMEIHAWRHGSIVLHVLTQVEGSSGKAIGSLQAPPSQQQTALVRTTLSSPGSVRNFPYMTRPSMCMLSAICLAKLLQNGFG